MKINIARMLSGTLLSLAISGCWNVKQGTFAVISLAPIDTSKKYEMVTSDALGKDTGIYWSLYATR